MPEKSVMVDEFLVALSCREPEPEQNRKTKFIRGYVSTSLKYFSYGWLLVVAENAPDV